MKRAFLLLVALLLAFRADGTPPPPKAAWTVLVYIQADNDPEHVLVENLGAFASHDFKSIEQRRLDLVKRLNW